MLTTLKLEGDVNHITQAKWMKWRSASRISVAEMKMLRQMSGHTQLDRIKNEYIRDRRDSRALVDEKMVESRLMWFGQVRRRPLEALIRRVNQMQDSLIVTGRRRPIKTLGETLQKYLELNEL